MDLEKLNEFDKKSNKFLIKFFCAVIVLGIVGKATGFVEDQVTDSWKEYKTNLIAKELAESLRGLELVIDPRGMQKKQIAEMNKEQLMMANYLLRLELEKFHTQMSSIREMSDTTPMF